MIRDLQIRQTLSKGIIQRGGEEKIGLPKFFRKSSLWVDETERKGKKWDNQEEEADSGNNVGDAGGMGDEEKENSDSEYESPSTDGENEAEEGEYQND